MKKKFINTFISFSLILLAGCGQSWIDDVSTKSTTVSGIVEPLASAFSSTNNFKAFNAYASTCADTTYAYLHSLNSDGSIDEDDWHAVAKLESSPRYEFNMTSLGLSTEGDSLQYIVRIVGCNNDVYKRAITDIDENQDVTHSSTLIAEVVNTNQASNLKNISKKELKSFESELSGTSESDVYNKIDSSPALKSKFQTIFGMSPDVLKEAKPEIIFKPIKNAAELEVLNYTVEAKHWSPTYSFAYSWKLDGVVKSTTKNFSYIPNKDDQGKKLIEVYVGQDDGGGNIDTTKPFYKRKVDLNIANTFAPIAPTMSYSSSLTTTPNITIKLNTGATRVNCQTLKSMALTIDDPNRPNSSSDFTINCTTAVEQDQIITLTGADGDKTIRLWAIDSSGNISETPKTLVVKLDTTNPTNSVSSITSKIKGGETITVNFSANDTVGIDKHEALFSVNDAAFVSLNNAIAGNATSYAWTVPTVNSNNVKFKLITTDVAGNTTASISNTFEIDSSAPAAPAIAVDGTQYKKATLIALTNSSCADRPHLFFGEGSTPAASHADWKVCNTTASGHGYILSNTTNEAKTIKVWAKDDVGNVSTPTSLNVIFDTINPVLSITDNIISLKGGDTYTLNWNLTEANAANTQNFLLEYFDGSSWNTIANSALSNGPHTNQAFTYNWSVPSSDGASFKYRVSYSDLAGNSNNTESSIFTIDSTAPTLTNFLINNNDANTSNPNVTVAFNAADNLSNVTEVCVKLASTLPATNDSCWTSLSGLGVTPSQNVAISNYTVTIPRIAGDYKLHVWAKDALGNISTNTNVNAADVDSIRFELDESPIIGNVFVANTDSPQSPPVKSETQFTLNSNVYISWKVTDNQSIPATGIKIYYTTDGITYSEIARDLANNANNGCSLVAGQTGCYLWSASAPTTQFFKIKLEVVDQGGNKVLLESAPLNPADFEFVAGNTSTGIGGSALNAIFKSSREEDFHDLTAVSTFVVTAKGEIFFADTNAGLLYINPETGLVTVVGRQTGTRSGDGGNLIDATFRYIHKITLDHSGNLLVWDYDRVRKINLNTTGWPINALFGGGSDETSGADAHNARVRTGASSSANVHVLFTVTPDGKVYFVGRERTWSKELWYFDPSTNKVYKKLTLNGVGTGTMVNGRENFDVSACDVNDWGIAYNPSNSELIKIMAGAGWCNGGRYTGYEAAHSNFNVDTGESEAPHPGDATWSAHKRTGMDGEIYLLKHGRSQLLKYNRQTNNWDLLVGNGQIGRCPDGTLATSCNATIMDVFVTKQGKIYFLDMGVIRYIDDSNKVQTIAGQSRSFGVGENALQARIAELNYFTRGNNKIYFMDRLERVIRNIDLTTNIVSHVAGDTTSSTANDDAKNTGLTSCGWSGACGLIIDTVNNRLYRHRSYNKLYYIDLNDFQWKTDDTTLNVDETSNRTKHSRGSFLGINNGEILFSSRTHSNDPLDNVNVKLLSTADHTKTQFIAKETVSRVFGQKAIMNCTDGEDAKNCVLPYAHSSYDMGASYNPDINSWIYGTYEQNKLYAVNDSTNVLTTYVTTNNLIGSYQYVKFSGVDYIFYCSTGGTLFKKVVSTGVETVISYPTPTMRCHGRDMDYDSATNQLYFIYEDNGLYGLVKYQL